MNYPEQLNMKLNIEEVSTKSPRMITEGQTSVHLHMMCIHLHICMHTYMYECIYIYMLANINAIHLYVDICFVHPSSPEGTLGVIHPPKNFTWTPKDPKSVGPAGFSSSKPSTIRVQSFVSWKCIVVRHPKSWERRHPNDWKTF